jgi:hypothetical protein
MVSTGLKSAAESLVQKITYCGMKCGHETRVPRGKENTTKMMGTKQQGLIGTAGSE